MQIPLCQVLIGIIEGEVYLSTIILVLIIARKWSDYKEIQRGYRAVTMKIVRQVEEILIHWKPSN